MADVLDTPGAGPAALRGSAVRSGAYVVGVALSIASAPILIRHLGITRFGAYVTAASVMTLIAGVTEGGLNAVALREYVRLEGDARRRAMRSLMGIRLALSVGGVALGILFAWAAGYDSPIVVGAIGAGVGVIFQATHLLVATPLQAELRFGALALIQLGGQVLTVGLIVLLVLADAGIVPFLWIGAPVGVLSLLVTALIVRGAMPLRPSLRGRTIWPLLRATLPYTAAVAVNVVYFRVTLLIMSLRATPLETGYFATSFRVVEVLIGVPGLVIGAAYPILARAERDDAERFRYAMRRILELALLLGAWMSLCCVVGAELAIDVLTGGAGDEAVDVLRLQGLAFVATAVGVAGGYALLTLERYRAMLWVTAAALVASASLALAVVGELGAEGAALATLAGELVATVGVLIALLRERPELASGLSGTLPILGSAAIGVAVGLGAGLPPVVDLVAANAVFVAGVALLGRFPPEFRELRRR